MEKRRGVRALTLMLPDFKKPYLSLGGKSLLLQNLSNGGIGVWIPKEISKKITRRTKAELLIGNQRYEITLELAHKKDNLVGFKLLETSEELKEIFRELLRPSRWAEEITFHPRSGELDSNTGFSRIWLKSNVEVELLIWHSHACAIVAIQLCLFGKWIFRELDSEPQTGLLRTDESRMEGTRIKDTSLFLKHDEPLQEFIQEASQFLTSLPRPYPGQTLWKFLMTGKEVAWSIDTSEAIQHIK